MNMLKGASRWVLLVGLAWALSGCASLRDAFLNWRQSSPPAAVQPAVDAELQKSLDRLYAEGASALARNDIDVARAAWRQYRAIAPAHLDLTNKVSGYLTLLQLAWQNAWRTRGPAGSGSH